MSAGAPFRYCGRDFSAAEIDWVRALIAQRPALRRAALSRALCERLGWRKPDGGLKDMSARVAMLRMHRDGLIALPPPRNRPRAMRPIPPSPATEPLLFPPPAHLGEVRPVRVEPIADAVEGRCWNAFVERHHYLGYTPLPAPSRSFLHRQIIELARACRSGPFIPHPKACAKRACSDRTPLAPCHDKGRSLSEPVAVRFADIKAYYRSYQSRERRRWPLALSANITETPSTFGITVGRWR